jgi:hypothetical protein
VRAGEQAVTYRDLTARAEALAGALVAGGLGRGDVVALHLERGPDDGRGRSWPARASAPPTCRSIRRSRSSA